MKRKTSSNKTEGKRKDSDTPRGNEEHKGKFSKPTFYSTAKRERTSEKPEGRRDFSNSSRPSDGSRGKFSKPSFNSSDRRERSSDRTFTPREDRGPRSSDRPEGRRDFSSAPRGKFSKPSFNSSDRSERSSDRTFTPREDRGPRSSDRPEGRRDFSSAPRGKFSKPSFNSSDRRERSSDRPFTPRDDRGPRSSEGPRGKFSKPSFNSSDKREESSEKSYSDRKATSDRPFIPREDRNLKSSDRPEGRRDFSDAPRHSKDSRGKFSKPSYKSDRTEGSSERPFTPREDKDSASSDRPEGRRGFSDSPRSSEEPKDRFSRSTSYKKHGSKNITGELPFMPGMPKVHNPHKLVESKPAPVFSDEIRLNKYISNAGICSRRKADELIGEGLVQVNGEVVQEMGFKVKPEDIVTYQGKRVINENKFYILLNKPKDFITTTSDERGRKTVMDLIKNATKGARVYPIGRLDRNTTGLLLFTNDGELAQHLSHPSTNVIKVYQAELDKPIEKDDLQSIRDGVELEDGFAQVDEIDITTPQIDFRFVGIAIHSGKNRIVRRIFEHTGYEVKALDRVAYAGLTKKDLPRGNWRYLTEKELVYLKYLTAGSVKK